MKVKGRKLFATIMVALLSMLSFSFSARAMEQENSTLPTNVIKEYISGTVDNCVEIPFHRESYLHAKMIKVYRCEIKETTRGEQNNPKNVELKKVVGQWTADNNNECKKILVAEEQTSDIPRKISIKMVKIYKLEKSIVYNFHCRGTDLDQQIATKNVQEGLSKSEAEKIFIEEKELFNDTDN